MAASDMTYIPKEPSITFHSFNIHAVSD